MEGICLFSRTYILYMNDTIVWGRIYSYLNFFLVLVLVFWVLFYLRFKKNTEIALAELKAEPLHCMIPGHHTLCEWNSLELCSTQPEGPNLVAPGPDTDRLKEKGDFSHN